MQKKKHTPAERELPELKDGEDLSWSDVSDEQYREYHFGDGKVFRIDEPVSLNVKRKPEGDSHRVLDADGKSHYVPAGWIAITLKV